MKLKQRPEDFVVEEIAEHALAVRGAFRLYLLEKRGLESLQLLAYLAKANHVPRAAICIAGLKDKHAITRQYLTVPVEHELRTLHEENFTITPLGLVQDPLNLGDLEGNRFTITLRELNRDELARIERYQATIAAGVPNYFDSQRFGSASGKDFIMAHVLRRDYEAAVKHYLTSTTPHEPRAVREEKHAILAAWPNIARAKTSSPNPRRVIDAYAKSGKWIEAYRAIPDDLRLLYVSAYQSFLWNECVKQLLIRSGARLDTVDYALGKLLYPKSAMPELPATFPTISELLVPDGRERMIIDYVLQKQGFALADFAIKQTSGSFFVTHQRPVVAVPREFRASAPAPDELNPRKSKITLSFTLSKGSYATIVTKALVGY